MKAGRLIIKTVLDNTGLDKGLAEVKAKGKLAGTNVSNLLGKGLKRALNLGKGLGKAFTVALKSIVKISAAIGGIGLLLGGLLVGVGILGLGFKKAFENEQIKANLDYIKFAITKALEPAVNRIADIIVKIVNLLFRIMQYINYIIYRWTGKNIFENASVDAYADSIKEADKNAKNLKKTLQTTGFDEMEILQDNSSATSSSTGGSAMPDFDLSNIEDMKIPAWIEWIAENKDLVISALLAIGAAFLVLQLGLGGWIALIVAAIVALVALIIQNWDKISAFLSKVGQWIYDNVIKPVVDFFVAMWEKIKQIFGPVIQFFVNIFTTIWNNIFTFISNIIQIVGFVWNKIIGILSPIVSWFYNNIIKPVINFFTTAWNFIIDKINKIIGLAKDIGTKVADVIGGAFKKVINAVLNAIESILNFPIRSINKLIDVINTVPGINLGKLQTFNLPRLRKGTILNNPGHGVPVAGGRAIAGEAGREAYLPLSDEQLLEELGSSIGRHVVVNLTNINKMNGRVLNRETKKVQSEDNFAYNG